MICPQCYGDKMIWAFGRSSFFRLPCQRCEETGVVPDEQKQWIENGKKLQQERIDSGLSIHQEAAKLGVKPSDICARENGRVNNEHCTD